MICNRNHCAHRRRGIALPLVLVCIVLATAMGATLTTAILVHYRRSVLLGQQAQTLWIADSAMQRAISKLRQASDYEGEVWEISRDDLESEFDAVVTIRVAPHGNDGTERRISVEAVYPDDGRNRIVQQREVIVGERS